MNRVLALAVLLLLGIGWGITQPFSKIAVSEGYRHFGLLFWQFAIGAAVLATISVVRGKGIPLGPRQVRFYVLIAVIGTLLPNAASFEAARFLPSGVLSIAISTVPMFAFPIALGLGIDRFSLVRLVGLCLGLAGVALLVWPEDALPDPALVVFIPLALVAPLFYAVEGNVVARWGLFGCDPIQVLLGASIVGAIMAAPLALATGTWIAPHLDLGAPDLALIASSVIHAFVYTGYVWLVGYAGSVFAAQVSYVVTGAGIGWAMLLLGESYSGWIWTALGLIFAGLLLVQPRRQQQQTLEAAARVEETGR